MFVLAHCYDGEAIAAEYTPSPALSDDQRAVAEEAALNVRNPRTDPQLDTLYKLADRMSAFLMHIEDHVWYDSIAPGVKFSDFLRTPQDEWWLCPIPRQILQSSDAT